MSEKPKAVWQVNEDEDGGSRSEVRTVLGIDMLHQLELG
jgi:hypothetical protein